MSGRFKLHLAQMHPIKLLRFNLHVFLCPDPVPKRFSKLPRDFYITFQRTFCLSSCRVYSRILLHPHRRELSIKFKFLFKFRRTFYLSSSQVCSSSCLLITQESTNQVKFSAADDFPSLSPKFLPGVPPEGVSVARDEGVGRASVGGHASVSDCYPPAPTSLPRLVQTLLVREKG